jgi:polyisoprenoid-binding protein YceI
MRPRPIRPTSAFLAALGLLASLGLALPPAALADSGPPTNIPAGHYVLDPRQSTVIARVKHFNVSLVALRFDVMAGSFDYNPDRPEATRVQASVDTGSLDVGADYSSKFADEFLHAPQFPKATFVSTDVRMTSPGQGTMTGNLTLMGVTKPVTFDVRLIGEGHELLPLPLGRRAAGFEATTSFKRSDFGSNFLINDNLVGDEVTLQIDAEFEHR